MTITTSTEPSIRSSYCRVCQAACGVLATVDDGRIVDVRGDPENALSRGYICSKGREAPAIHHGANRLRASLRRTESGGHVAVPVDQALDDIADRLAGIVDQHGPDAVALFLGTHALFNALTPHFARGWLRALGSRSLYTTGTIDQSAKWLVPMRMGYWRGGWQRFADADVWLLCGTNPLVSMQGGGTLTGFPAYDPVKRLREATRRGLKLIVIDPRRTETARHAHLHLQPKPGTDWAIFAGMLNVILRDELHDVPFCSRYVADLEALADAVTGFPPDRAAGIAGVDAADLDTAARCFAQADKGMAHGGTGPDMAPHCNLTEHLIAALNVVCGRYPRAGEPVANPGVMRSPADWREGVGTFGRQWEAGPHTSAGYGALWGERPTTALPDEILRGDPGRVRALIVMGGNPVACWPDQARARRALEALDLLVVIDPRMTETAALAHYVIAPTLAFERPDHTVWHETLFVEPFAQHTPALIDPPPDTIDDWRVFCRLGRRMGVPIPVADEVLDPQATEPGAQEMLRRLGSRGRVDYDEVCRAPHGGIWPSGTRVAPDDGSTTRFELLPEDVAAELQHATSSGVADDRYPLRLICRRSRWLMNSLDSDWPSARRAIGVPTAWAHPLDLAGLGIAEGATAAITSATGRVDAVMRADAALRRGVVAMPHCQTGGSTGRLVDAEQRAAVNAMPVMSAIPVRLECQDGAS